MDADFFPPGISSLTEIDTAVVSYDHNPVIVQGVVSPSGQGGWGGTNPQYEIHCLSFAAWQIGDEPIVEREMTILRPVLPDADYFEDFPKLTIQSFRLMLSTDRTRAIFVQSLPAKSRHADLSRIAMELKKPVIVTTKRFGDLILDRRIDVFQGEGKWNRRTVSISCDRDESGGIENALMTAEALWDDQKSWRQRVEAIAVKELLPLKNENWLDEDEAELTADDFLSRMKLTSIGVHADGEFDFWHDDGDLFSGHSIQVSGNLQDGPTRANIAG